MMFAIFWSNTLRGVGLVLFAGAEAFVAFAATLALLLAFAALGAAFLRVLAVVSGITRNPHKVELILV